MGGYKVQGKTLKAVEQLMHDALALERAGACCVVLEGIPREVAAMITHELEIPTIGIGAGPECDGQVLVFHDLLGLTFAPPAKFVRRYADVGAVISNALLAFKDDVKSGGYPSDAESYHLPKETLAAPAGDCRTQARLCNCRSMRFVRARAVAGVDHNAEPVSLAFAQAATPAHQAASVEAILPARWRLLLQISNFLEDAGRDLRRQWRGRRASAEGGPGAVGRDHGGDGRAAARGRRRRHRAEWRHRAGDGRHARGRSRISKRCSARSARSTHKPAQMLKARYREKATGRDWIEELVFIQGPDNEIYSVALKCAPQIMRSGWSRCLHGVLESWTLPEPEPPADPRRAGEGCSLSQNPQLRNPISQ